jgi:hypothetical protein
MKSITLIFGSCILFCLNSFGQDFKKWNNSEVVDKTKINIAQDFASNFLNKLKKGETYIFKDNAIDILKNQLTEENQKLVYQQFKTQFGDFESLEYAETWVQGSSKSIQIIRFKSVFEKSNRKLEIRVVLNDSGKVAGFWIKPWSDMLN